MPPADDALFQAAYDLLSAATTLLDGDAPDTRYVATPIPSLDCPEQLTVHSDSLLKEMIADVGALYQFASVTGPSQNSFGLILSCTRCTPIPDDPAHPPAADLTAVALRTLTDLCVLWYGTQRMIRDGTLWSAFQRPSEDRVFMGPALPIADQGGSAGWAITYRLEL